jgi:hypothetical protein
MGLREKADIGKESYGGTPCQCDSLCQRDARLETTPAHGVNLTDGPWMVERFIQEATE